MEAIKVRALKKDERLVFEAIAKQSLRYPDKPFAYNIDEGQLYINKTGAKIDREKHMEIIRILDEDGVIEADWLLPPEEEHLPTLYCEFAQERDWSRKVLIDLEIIIPYKFKYNDYYFINLHPKHIENIRKASEPAGIANITINEDDRRYIDVIIKETKTNKKKIITIQTFKSEEDRVYCAVNYALSVKFATKHMLRTKAKINSGELLLKELNNVPKIFDGNTIINGVLKPFFDISSKGLGINHDIELSRYELELIEASTSTV